MSAPRAPSDKAVCTGVAARPRRPWIISVRLPESLAVFCTFAPDMGECFRKGRLYTVRAKELRRIPARVVRPGSAVRLVKTIIYI